MDVVHLEARLLFVEHDAERVTLDYIAAGDGTPFTVAAELPSSTAWATVLTSDVLDEWAASDEPIDITIRRGSAGLSVQMVRDSTQLNLHVAA